MELVLYIPICCFSLFTSLASNRVTVTAATHTYKIGGSLKRPNEGIFGDENSAFKHIKAREKITLAVTASVLNFFMLF